MQGFRAPGTVATAVLAADQEIRGVRFAARPTVTCDQSGEIRRGSLAGPWVCQDMEFPRGSSVHLSHDGSLQKVCLGEDAVIRGMACCKNQTMMFDAEGKAKPLPHPG